MKIKKRKIFAEKFGSLKIMRTFAAPFEKRATTSSLKRLETVQASTEKKYNLSRSVNSFERNYEVSETSLEIYRLLYNEEFDPGSG